MVIAIRPLHIVVLIGVFSVGIMTARAVERPTEAVESCLTGECHSDLTQRRFLHGPVAQKDCSPCHVLVSAQKHTFALTTEGPALCYVCHEAEPTLKFVHSPFQTSCTVCHDAHTGDSRDLLVTKTTEELCRKCHIELAREGAYVHGPVAVGDCLTCHRAHQSDFPKLLVSTKQEVCFDCHTEIQERLAEQATVHDPITKDCLTCHYMHASPYEFLLRHDPKDTCMQCHQNLVEEMKEFQYHHNAVSMSDQCLNCHDPHASPTDQLLKDFSMDICLECHDRKITTANMVIPDIKEQLTTNSNLHGPLREKNCLPCHNVHGSNTFRLLALDFPENFYAPFEVERYELCFHCHEKNLVLEPKTTALTDFRNGDLNLHFLHVNKKERGRSCRACHAEHASNNPVHIRDAVPYGNWILRIVYTETENGGRCFTGCHAERTYDRVTPVQYDLSQ